MLDFRRRAVLAAAAAGAVSMPYVMSNTGVMGWIHGTSQGEQTTPSDDPYGVPLKAASGSSTISAAGLPYSPPLEGYPVMHLGEILNFQVTQDWIVQRWPQVYTLTNQTDLAGYRVPVVTGESTFDLAGSLTYYFDRTRTLQKIEFHGTTGDPQMLVQLVTTQHGLTPRESQSAGRQIYQRQWDGKPESELRVETAALLSAAAPHRKYHVHLLLARPVEGGWFNSGQQNALRGRL